MQIGKNTLFEQAMAHPLVKKVLGALSKEDRERIEIVAKAYADGFTNQVLLPVSNKVAKAKEDPKAAEELKKQIENGTLISDLTGRPIDE